MTINIDTTQHQFLFLRDNTGKIIHNTDIVVTNHTQGDAILRRSLTTPLGLNNTIPESAAQLGGIRTIATVNLDTAINGNKAKHIVAIDRRTAFCQLVIQALQVTVYHQHVIVHLLVQTRNLRLIKFEFRSRTRLIISCNNGFFSSEFQELIKHIVCIQHTIGNGLIKVAYLLVTHLTDYVEHDTVVLFNLTVAELTLQHLLGKQSVLNLGFLQRQTYLGFGTRGLHNIQPLLSGFLVSRCQDFNLVATLQFVAYRHHFSANATARTLVAQFRVDMVSKIKHRSTCGKLPQIACRCKHKHLVFVQFHLKLVHSIQSVGMLQHRTYIRQPLVQPRLALHAFIAPVGSYTAFGNLVHTFGTYLYLNPLLLWAQHRDVQTLVAIRFGYRQPVAQSFRVRLIHIGNNRVSLPALHFLLLQRTIDNDTDGKQIIHTLKRALLLLHLLPDRVD